MFFWNVAYIDIPDQYTPFLWIKKSCNNICKGRLAAAGRADQRQTLTGLDVKADMVEHLVVVVGVLKADVVKVDAAVLHDQRLRVGGIGDG
mgnify:CR=1 FL=1